MFSCCCARVNFRWTPVCGCYNGGALARSTCDKSCLEQTVRDPATLNYFTFAKVRVPGSRHQFLSSSPGPGL